MAVVLETNFVRLLNCTEDLAEDGGADSYEYAAYVKKLEEFLLNLKSISPRPSAEFLHIYETRVKQLNNIRDPTRNTSPYLKLIEDDAIICGASHQRHAEPDQKLVSTATIGKDSTSIHSLSSSQCAKMSRYFSDTPNLLQDERNKNNQELRQRLLGPSNNSAYKSATVDDNTNIPESTYGDVLINHSLKREKLADEMLGLANDLRLTSVAIGEKIRSDIRVLEDSNLVAARNAASLADVSKCLKEELGQKFGLIVWILFLISICVFFWLVIFMKFTTKVH